MTQNAEVMNEDEMKTITGGYGSLREVTDGFNCGGKLRYFVGECPNGKGVSICASENIDAAQQLYDFCRSYL